MGGEIHIHTLTHTHTHGEMFQKDTTLILLCDLKQIHEKLKNEIQSKRNKEYTVLVNNINLNISISINLNINLILVNNIN